MAVFPNLFAMCREYVMIWSACVTLLSGIVMSFLAFLSSPNGEISDSVLWYFAQCLMYAASALGVSVYVKFRLDEISKSRK